ncbi:MAG TPA: PIN domain-containing protein [Terracidiphilus sp.]|nr:PIN domain-containing protein [Terracidiphilus sp.]
MSRSTRIFFDTNIFIYMFEGIEPNRSRMLEIRRRMLERGDRIVTSAMTLGEILVKPTKLGQASLIEQYDRAIRSTADVISFDAQVAWRFATLRATHNLRCADAIQLACAAHFGVDLFITSDQQLHKLDIPGIGFIAPLEKVPL